MRRISLFDSCLTIGERSFNIKSMNNCPKCKTNLDGEDIYEYFLNKYSKPKEGFVPVTKTTILRLKKEYPTLYQNFPSNAEIKKMTRIQLSALYTANQYGWTKQNPKKFQKQIGIEIPGVYDGVIVWQCPDCGHKWKRFDWVSDKYLISNGLH